MTPAASVALLYDRTGEPVTVRRAGAQVAGFNAFVTSVDITLLEDRFTSASHRITFPTASGRLDAGDHVEHAAATYLVLRDSIRIRDGHESEATLSLSI